MLKNPQGTWFSRIATHFVNVLSASVDESLKNFFTPAFLWGKVLEEKFHYENFAVMPFSMWKEVSEENLKSFEVPARGFENFTKLDSAGRDIFVHMKNLGPRNIIFYFEREKDPGMPSEPTVNELAIAHSYCVGILSDDKEMIAILYSKNFDEIGAELVEKAHNEYVIS